MNANERLTETIMAEIAAEPAADRMEILDALASSAALVIAQASRWQESRSILQRFFLETFDRRMESVEERIGG